MWMRLLPACALLAACASSRDDDITPQPADLTVLGPQDVGVEVTGLDLGDRDGFASVVSVRIYYPADRTQPTPVVILDHGFAVRAESYNDSAAHLASWGFIVLVPQWDSGIPTARSHLGLAEDHVALVDALQRQALPIPTSADLTRIGAVGHSRGGKQALHAALLDDRIDVVVGWDPVDALPPFGMVDPAEFPSVTPELIGGLTQPALLLGSARGGEGAIPCAPVDDNHRAFWDAAPDGTIDALVPASGHNDVLDECAEGVSSLACSACTPGDDPQAVATFLRAAATSFLAESLLEDEPRLHGWVQGDQAASLAPGLELLVKGQDTPADEPADTDADTDG